MKRTFWRGLLISWKENNITIAPNLRLSGHLFAIFGEPVFKGYRHALSCSKMTETAKSWGFRLDTEVKALSPIIEEEVHGKK